MKDDIIGYTFADVPLESTYFQKIITDRAKIRQIFPDLDDKLPPLKGRDVHRQASVEVEIQKLGLFLMILALDSISFRAPFSRIASSWVIAFLRHVSITFMKGGVPKFFYERTDFFRFGYSPGERLQEL